LLVLSLLLRLLRLGQQLAGEQRGLGVLSFAAAAAGRLG
jgi:hypothetical protein